ncbi:MAG: large-conductance mechanosensitive channel protein MscL [Clostridiaceae bacterium]|jgi:large conductance mechanosensitive channel|nr:large-conductance mechanosensitive channel protein MscL [Clostridiaceae bacterium]
MKKFIQDFKDFAIKGNVIDMAVGVVIGSAFGKIVTSLVNDIITPAISMLTGKVSLSNLSIDISGVKGTDEYVGIMYGQFIQNIIDFLIIAFSIFLVIKLIGKFKRKEAKVEEAAEKVEEEKISKEQELLTEIRDILKEK